MVTTTLGALVAQVLEPRRRSTAFGQFSAVPKLGDLVAVLPELSRQWERGGTDAAIRVELVHGHEEQWRAWARHAALTPPKSPFNAYPNLEVLRDLIAPQAAEVAASYDLRARAVIPASVVITDDDRTVVATLARAGMQIRFATRVDSWFYSDSEVLCALPLVWGEHPPSSIMIIHDPVIRALAAAYAEAVWKGAASYTSAANEWDDVLRLLGHGMPEHYRVGTRFELGAAWGRRQSNT